MQPSGEVGRFEVDDQSSPPADRYRYVDEEPRTHTPTMRYPLTLVHSRLIGARSMTQWSNRGTDNRRVLWSMPSLAIGLRGRISDRITGWTGFRSDPVDPVHPVDNSTEEKCSAPCTRNVARTGFGRIQSAGTRVGLSGSVHAAKRHVTTKCTGDRGFILGDGRSMARSP